MGKYYVYYRDGYAVEDGGMEVFNNAKDAQEFILNRHANGEVLSGLRDGSFNCYTVIYGVEKKIRTVEKITDIVIE